MLKGEEFRKNFLTFHPVCASFFWASRRGNVIAVDRVKMEVAISTLLHRVGAFKNLETNIALKITAGYWQNCL